MNLKKEEETSYMNISNDGNISSDPIIKVEDAFYTAQKKYKEKNKVISSSRTRKGFMRCNL